MDKKYDYTLLRRRILAKYKSFKDFSESLGICTMSLWRKLNGETDFTIKEVDRICELLEIKKEDMHEYFLKEIN